MSLPPTNASRIPSSAASVNATVAKASGGHLHFITGMNGAVTVRYLKFYDKAATPVVGTDTPVLTVALPASTAFSLDMGGFTFANGIGYGITVLAPDADASAIAAADILGLNIMYD